MINNRISIIGPGLNPIPPVGWGAVENLVWMESKELEARGFDVQIINTNNQQEIIDLLLGFKPSLVYLHYDEYIEVINRIRGPLKIITSHYGYLGSVYSKSDYQKIFRGFIRSDAWIFALSEEIRQVYILAGASEKRIKVLPNPVDPSLLDGVPPLPGNRNGRSICIGKIEPRKNQAFLQRLSRDRNLAIDFVGNVGDGRGFDTKSSDYIGHWSREDLRKNLGNYSSLVLLSLGEAHPLVVMEALAQGLGVVVSEVASANLDTSLPFIAVLTQEDLRNSDRVEFVIRLNREIAARNRQQIISYARARFSPSVWCESFIEHCRNAKLEELRLILDHHKPTDCLFTLATGAYFDMFIPRLLSSKQRFFLRGRNVVLVVFTDKVLIPQFISTALLLLIPTRARQWPFASSERWSLMLSVRGIIPASVERTLFIDSDMEFVQDVGSDELSGDLFYVVHPGYQGKEPSTLPFERRAHSSAFVSTGNLEPYVQACFFGGETGHFFYLVYDCLRRQERDSRKGVVACWYDESYLNAAKLQLPRRYLPPTYAYPQDYGPNNAAKIIHLSKPKEIGLLAGKKSGEI